MSNTVTVACPCPGKPHSEDIITLHPEVTVPLAVAARSLSRQLAPRIEAEGEMAATAEAEGALALIYLHLGIESWTFVDGAGRQIRLTPENIDRLLPYAGGGVAVVQAADALYSEAIFNPLAGRPSEPSNAGQMVDLTSASRRSGSSSRTLSGRSSRVSTAGLPYTANGR